MEDTIVREIVVAAPPARVWEVLTRPEYLLRWFGAETAEIDLRPGGALVMKWAEHGTGYARVERVDEPAPSGSAPSGSAPSGSGLFSFHWAVDPGVQPVPGEQTLVEFTLTPEADGTRLRVVESGFTTLDRPAEKQEWHRERNVDGWRQVLEAAAGGATEGSG